MESWGTAWAGRESGGAGWESIERVTQALALTSKATFLLYNSVVVESRGAFMLFIIFLATSEVDNKSYSLNDRLPSSY